MVILFPQVPVRLFPDPSQGSGSRFLVSHLECGDAPLSNTGTRPGDQSADPSAHSKNYVRKKSVAVILQRTFASFRINSAKNIAFSTGCKILRGINPEPSENRGRGNPLCWEGWITGENLSAEAAPRPPD